MESSTLVSVDDIVEVLPRLGEPLPEAEVIVSRGSAETCHGNTCTGGSFLEVGWPRATPAENYPAANETWGCIHRASSTYTSVYARTC